jgi:hypothetical protein
MSKTIPLSKGKYAIVDDADYEYLSQFKWYAFKGRNTYYAKRTLPFSDGKHRKVYMHREIMGAGDDALIDHEDGNGLNNTRDNLRLATRSQNNYNRISQPGSSSPYKGVTWSKCAQKWQAQIKKNRHQMYLGLYDLPEDAARAYDIAAIQYFGDFAKLNFEKGQAP